MYKQFAITIAVSVVLSGIVALTLTPALCAVLLRPVPEGAPAGAQTAPWREPSTACSVASIAGFARSPSATSAPPVA